MLFHSLLEVAENANRSFGLNGKRLYFRVTDPSEFEITALDSETRRSEKKTKQNKTRLLVVVYNAWGFLW